MYSEESLFGGRLVCRQHRAGYRFSVDAVLLAHFAGVNGNDLVLELGAGCGIVSLALAYRNPTAVITAVEIQPPLVGLIQDNVSRNGYDERITVLSGDYRKVSEFINPGSFDLVVANPPYRPSSKSRRAMNDERAAARQELHGGVESAVSAAFWALRDQGRVAMVFPADRAATLVNVLKEHHLEPKRFQAVHPYPGSVGKLVLVEAKKYGGEGLVVLPPIFMHDQQGGGYTDDILRMYE